MRKQKILSAFVGVLIAGTIFLPAPLTAAPKGKAEHVVVLVWDGMRPDFITPQYTPTLYSLARQGVFFNKHHPVFPSTTEVNGTALVTGVYPNRNGILANSEYRPEISFLAGIATEGIDNVRRADFLTGGHYLLYPTLAETLQQAGYPTITTGTKPVVLLHDRTARRLSQAQTNSAVLFAGQTMPKSLLKDLEKVNDDKKFPTNNPAPNSEKDNWTTKAVVHGLWKKGVPKYTLLWLYDPDSTQHAEGVGSDQALAGIANSDKCLEDILKYLDEKKLRDKTDVIVTSDHGFSNIKRGPDVVEALKKAKFKAVRKFEDPEPGEILVVGAGSAMSFYVVDHDGEMIRKLVEYLKGTDFTGVIFTRLPMEGAFPMEAARINTTNVVPDVVISMRWLDEASENGTPGLVIADGGTRGKGTHGSLSRYDMHNIMVAAGPDFKKGLVDDLPTGGVDVAPTILWILAVDPLQPMDGRVLHEALTHSQVAPPTPETKTIEASSDLGWFRWGQYLKFTQMGQTIYLDEGNGGMKPK
jgi:predicted AlkP superfamily pyrophosphatase or phosphodiesterase